MCDFKTDLFEKNLAKVLDKHLSKHNFKVRRKADSLGDLSIEYIPTGKRFPFELKTTQGKDFQGSTHSARKCDDYILIRFNLDYNQKFISINDKHLNPI